MEKKQRKQLVIQMLTAGIITFCLLWLLFYIKKYVPFGVHSLASKDADFQYLDFLAYLKDVFDGKNNIDYSFSKSIGGACIGVFSYYLSSPFNLLLLLFDKSQFVESRKSVFKEVLYEENRMYNAMYYAFICFECLWWRCQ